MIKRQFPFTRRDQTILSVQIDIVDVNNNDRARVRTRNDRCGLEEMKEIWNNENSGQKNLMTMMERRRRRRRPAHLFLLPFCSRSMRTLMKTSATGHLPSPTRSCTRDSEEAVGQTFAFFRSVLFVHLIKCMQLTQIHRKLLLLVFCSLTWNN